MNAADYDIWATSLVAGSGGGGLRVRWRCPSRRRAYFYWLELPRFAIIVALSKRDAILLTGYWPSGTLTWNSRWEQSQAATIVQTRLPITSTDRQTAVLGCSSSFGSRSTSNCQTLAAMLSGRTLGIRDDEVHHAIGDQPGVVDDRGQPNSERQVGEQPFDDGGVDDADDERPLRDQADQSKQRAIGDDGQGIDRCRFGAAESRPRPLETPAPT